MIINGLQRKDDGLYECQARNEGGQFFKSGHIQVSSPRFLQFQGFGFIYFVYTFRIDILDRKIDLELLSGLAMLNFVILHYATIIPR